MFGNVEIRMADATDCNAVMDIYRPYVTDTAITFANVMPTEEAFRARMERVARRFPYLVCTIEDQVVGFAFAAEERPHDAYQWNAELSIYLDPRFHRRGVATALYNALISILKAQGFYNLYAVIALPNDASIALHRHFGFEEAFVNDRSGFKMGQWRDTIWMRLRLKQPCRTPERPPKLIEELALNELTTACAMATALLSGAQ